MMIMIMTMMVMMIMAKVTVITLAADVVQAFTLNQRLF